MIRNPALALVLAFPLAAPLACADDAATSTGGGSGGSGASSPSGPTSTTTGAGSPTSSSSGSGVGGDGAGGTGIGGGAGGTGAGGSGGAGGGGSCKDLGTACLAGSECCSGACDETALVCTNIGACLQPGEACELGPDCCNFSCVDGTCSDVQCTADGEACAVDGECCGGQCPSGICEPLGEGCSTSGNPCSDGSECCSSFCDEGLCSPPSYCTQSGDICTIDFECCAGLCEKEAGASVGLCGTVPATGAGNCSTAGQVCGDGAVFVGGELPVCGGECCSRACFPYGPTGVLICQPPSGCRPTGEVCANDVDCCGSETLPDGRTSDIHCSKVGDNPLGRCDAGNACTPAGGICRLEEIECNANANCCSGNVLQFDTCKQDNLGIPRCLAAEIDCTDPSSFVGDACASSADCCNLPCVPNPNGDPPFVCGGECVPTDGTCTTTADCCAGLPCIIPPGQASGQCGEEEGSGGAGGAGGGGNGGSGGGSILDCAEYGQSCNGPLDCCNTIPCNGGFCIVN